MLDVESFLLGMAAGGGNPNTVETYSGTTSDIMANVSDFDALMSDIDAGNVTAMLSLSALNDIAAAGILVLGGLLFSVAAFVTPQDTEPVMGAAYLYTSGSVAPVYGKFLYRGNWESLDNTACKLMIIHHQMP